MFTLARWTLMLVGAFTIYSWINGVVAPTPQDLAQAGSVAVEAAPQVSDRLDTMLSNIPQEPAATSGGQSDGNAGSGAAEQAFDIVVRVVTGIGGWILDQMVSIAQARSSTG